MFHTWHLMVWTTELMAIVSEFDMVTVLMRRPQAVQSERMMEADASLTMRQ